MEGSQLFIEFQHANLNQKVYLARALIFAYYYSETHKCTLVIATGGATVPVKESVDEVLKKVRS